MTKDRKNRPEEVDELREELHEEGTEHKFKGAAREARGRIEQAAGDLVDDESLHAKGTIRKAQGRTERRIGEAVEDAADEI